MVQISIKIFVLFAGISFCNASLIPSSTSRLDLVFHRYKVVPNILENVPQKVLTVANHEFIGGMEPLPGTRLNKNFFESKPCIKMDMADDMNVGGMYTTVIVYDADACCHSRNLLWMKKNIILGKKNDEETEYYIPSGCKTLHRIIFLVYQHNHALDYDLENLGEYGSNATNFNLKYFVEHYNLGPAVQGNLLLSSLTDNDCLITIGIVILYVLSIITFYYLLKCIFTKYLK